MFHITERFLKGLCLEIKADAIRDEIKKQLSFIVPPHEAGVVIKRNETVCLITALTTNETTSQPASFRTKY